MSTYWINIRARRHSRCYIAARGAKNFVRTSRSALTDTHSHVLSLRYADLDYYSCFKGIMFYWGKRGVPPQHIVAHYIIYISTKLGARSEFSLFYYKCYYLNVVPCTALMALEAINFCFSSAPPACILIMFLLHLPKRVYICALSECVCQESVRCITAWKIEFQINIWEPVYAFFGHREGPCFCSYEFTFVITFPREFIELLLLSFHIFFTLSLSLYGIYNSPSLASVCVVTKPPLRRSINILGAVGNCLFRLLNSLRRARIN